MNLLQMSFCGTIIILAVLLIRAAMHDRLPKRTFLVLWSIVLFRLLVPVEISSELSVYSLLDYDIKFDSETDMEVTPNNIVHESLDNTVLSNEVIKNRESDLSGEEAFLPGIVDILWKYKWLLIRGAGTFICVAYFAVVYVRCRREFSMSLPVYDKFLEQWMEKRSMSCKNILIRRFTQRIDVRVSDRIDTPLTYGILHPVILLPKNMDWDNKERLSYILWHEYTHICHCDAVRKLLAATAACIHWFNLSVWIMYYILGHDIELACDESVLKRRGIKGKSAYANVLIDMEAGRSGIWPLCNNFSRNIIERRIRAIMKIKKLSMGAVIMAVGLVCGVMLFLTTSSADRCDEKNNYATYNKNFTAAEYEKLRAFCFDGYENMSVSDYRDKVLSMTGKEYQELLERFYEYEATYKYRDSDELSFFIYHVLRPLMTETWRENEFQGNNIWNGSIGESEKMQGIDYGLTLNIMNENELTVGEYVSASHIVSSALHSVVDEKTEKQLASEEYMERELSHEAHLIKKKLNTYKLSVGLTFTYYSETLEGLPSGSDDVVAGVVTVYLHENENKEKQYVYSKRNCNGI